jgi:uncharacterized protein
MRFNAEYDIHHYIIRGYSDMEIRVSLPVHMSEPNATTPPREILTSSFIMTPQRLIKNWPPRSVQQLTTSHFEELFELEPEVLLLGTGKFLVFPPLELTTPLMTKGVGVEVMDTAAACRTYNILVSEGRNVAGAFIL